MTENTAWEELYYFLCLSPCHLQEAGLSGDEVEIMISIFSPKFWVGSYFYPVYGVL